MVLVVDLHGQTLQLRARQPGACIGPPGRVVQCNDPMGRFARDDPTGALERKNMSTTTD